MIQMADVETVIIDSTNGKKEEVKVDSGDDVKECQSDLTKLEQDIIRQVEYYFSESNLRRDKFLIQKVAENEGFVEISVLLTFNRLKSITEDAKTIADAMDKSPHGTVQLSDDRLKVRRHPDNPLPEFNESRRKEIQARTAYAKGFPLDSQLDVLLDYFNNNFENVEHLIMRKYFCPKTKNHLFKGSVFVTFGARENSEEFVNKPELKYGEKELLRYTQSAYNDIKKKEREEVDKKKKAKKEAKELAADKEEFNLPKAAVVHFVGVTDAEISREDIKAKIADIESSLDIAFIHFQKGEKDGDIRFQKENQGKTLMDKLTDGKVRFFNFKLI